MKALPLSDIISRGVPYLAIKRLITSTHCLPDEFTTKSKREKFYIDRFAKVYAREIFHFF